MLMNPAPVEVGLVYLIMHWVSFMRSGARLNYHEVLISIKSLLEVPAVLS